MKRKTDIILLAAGNSSRFGMENKMHYEVNGESMLLHAVITALQLRKHIPDRIQKILVVTTKKNAEILPREIENQVQLVYNRNSERGISSSIQLGVQNAVKENHIMFMVCDQPWICAETVEKMIGGFYEAILKNEVEYGCLYSEKMGMANPCIFRYSQKEKLLALTGDRGGKILLKQHPEKVYCHPVEQEKELVDMDEKKPYI